MNKKFLFIIIIIIVILIVVFLTSKKSPPAQLTSIRIGWQTAWVPQAQLAQILKHTDILERNNLKGEFKGFNYGGPLSEAALAGEVDVAFVGDFPAIILLAKTEGWSIIGRLNDFRNGIIVPKNSPIQSIRDLKGKTIAIPFGSGPHARLMNWIEENGYNPAEFNIKNLDILEQSNIIQKGSLESWGDIDAFATWDPTIALFEENGKARVLQMFNPVGVIVMSNNFINQHEIAAKNFLKAFIEGYFYYAQNQQQANQWFADETKFTHPFSTIDKMVSLEKNLLAKSVNDVDIKLYDSHLANMQALAEGAEKNGLIPKAPWLSQRTNQELFEDALKNLDKSFNPEEVKLK
jgi:ABC-type nitrate/sulfonate/bicarbonate transport system substrate-binding protein